MKKKSVSKPNMGFLSFLCCLSYFVSYLTRLNYAACLVELQNALQISKSLAGLPVTGSFLTYGAGQLICGLIGDRLAPQKVIFTGLLGTALCNILVAAFPQMNVILPVWCVNGLFQSMMWPPLVRIMAEQLDEVWFQKCSVLVSLASSVGAIAIYVFVPLCFLIWGWQAAFFLPAAIAAATACFWYFHTRTLPDRAAAPAAKKSFDFASLFTVIPLIPVLTAIVLMGVLRDGITTWMPAYLMEGFGVNTSASVLMTAVIPLFSIFSTLFASALYGKLKDELLTGGILFTVGTCSCILMLFAHGRCFWCCILLMMLITGCTYGVNLMLISRLPKYFAGLGMVSTVSGLLNAFTYVGSAVSTYGFGAVAESGGWFPVILLWLLVAGSGSVILFAARRKWKQKEYQSE